MLGFFALTNSYAQVETVYDDKINDLTDVTALMSAVVNNDLVGVRFFSKSARSDINQPNLGGATALHLACRDGNFEIAKILIENGANINLADKEGWTPLMRAALAPNKKLVSLLLENKVDATRLNIVGESAILHATTSDCDSCLQEMFDNFDFIEFVNSDLLKDQLTEAFIISKNHDNLAIQNILEKYLDKVVKHYPASYRSYSSSKRDGLYGLASEQNKSDQENYVELIPLDGQNVDQSLVKNEASSEGLPIPATETPIDMSLEQVNLNNVGQSDAGENEVVVQQELSPPKSHKSNKAKRDQKELALQKTKTPQNEASDGLITENDHGKVGAMVKPEPILNLTNKNISEEDLVPEIVMPIFKDSDSKELVADFSKAEGEESRVAKKMVFKPMKDNSVKLRTVPVPVEDPTKFTLISNGKKAAIKKQNAVGDKSIKPNDEDVKSLGAAISTATDVKKNPPEKVTSERRSPTRTSILAKIPSSSIAPSLSSEIVKIEDSSMLESEAKPAKRLVKKSGGDGAKFLFKNKPIKSDGDVVKGVSGDNSSGVKVLHKMPVKGGFSEAR